MSSDSVLPQKVALKVEALLPWKDRIDVESLASLLNAIHFEVDRAIGEGGPQLRSLQIDFALMPGGERAVRLHPSELVPGDNREALRTTLEQLPLPAVREVVAFICVVSDPKSQDARILPPFGGSLPAALNEAFRQYEEERKRAALLAAGPRSGFGVLVNLARRGLRYLKRQATPGHRQTDLATNPNPLLGRLSGEYLQYMDQLSDSELDERITLDPKDANYYMLRAGRRAGRGAHDQAVEDFTQVIRLAPDVAKAYLQRSWCFAEEGQLERALQDVNAAIKLCPEHPDVYEARAGLYFRLEAWQAAEADFSRCIAINPLKSSYYFWRSKARWIQTGRLADAVSDLDEALRLNPFDIEALATRLTIPEPAEVEQPQLSDEERITYLDRAIRYGPPHPPLLMRRAYAYLSSGDAEKALAMCGQALQLDENYLSAVAVRGLAHYAMGDVEQAFADLSRAIDGDVAWPEVYCRRAEIFNAQNEHESAARDADQALVLDHEFAPAWLGRGAARGNMDDHDAAKEDFLKARDLAPAWYAPHFHLGITNLVQGDYEAARENFSRAIELEPAFPIAWLRRGNCHLEQKEDAAAFEDFNRALELDPDLAEAFAARAEAWSRKGEYRRAADDVTSAIKLEPENVGLLFQRAQFWTELGEYNRACADFNELIRLCPGLAHAYTGRGYIWTQIGHQEQAEQDYQEAILCDPAAAGQIRIHQALAEAAYHHRYERYDKAAHRAGEALEIDSDCRPALSLRAAAYWYDEEFLEAVDDYTRLLELDGDAFTLLSSRGQVRVEMKEFELGLADLDRAIQLGAETQTREYMAYARSGRALALAGLDRFEEARAEFEASIADCPQNAWVHYNHGRVYDKLGEHHKAAICFQLSLALEDPRLTPRKRERAKAYCEKHLQPPPGESITPSQQPSSVSK